MKQETSRDHLVTGNLFASSYVLDFYVAEGIEIYMYAIAHVWRKSVSNLCSFKLVEFHFRGINVPGYQQPLPYPSLLTLCQVSSISYLINTEIISKALAVYAAFFLHIFQTETIMLDIGTYDMELRPEVPEKKVMGMSESVSVE